MAATSLRLNNINMAQTHVFSMPREPLGFTLFPLSSPIPPRSKQWSEVIGVRLCAGDRRAVIKPASGAGAPFPRWRQIFSRRLWQPLDGAVALQECRSQGGTGQRGDCGAEAAPKHTWTSYWPCWTGPRPSDAEETPQAPRHSQRQRRRAAERIGPKPITEVSRPEQ